MVAELGRGREDAWGQATVLCLFFLKKYLFI